MRNRIYINGRSCISPQLTYNNDLNGLGHHYDDRLISMEPDYKTLPPGMINRRMVKLTKMGVYAAIHALKDAQLTMPDAIITGSGLGSMEDTEKFLIAMMESDEGLLNPTAFMQSTHNTVGGQISLILGCKGYNFTYVQKGMSFESALLDSMMHIWENKDEKILLGAYDETTDQHITITARLGFWKTKPMNTKDLLWDKDPGNLPGQGAAFFAVSNQITDKTYSEIADLQLKHQEKEDFDVLTTFAAFLEKNDLQAEDIDLLVLGRSGCALLDVTFNTLESEYAQVNRAYFKHLCGENYTATSFAVWLSDMIIRDQMVPKEMLPTGPTPKKINNVVIYNQYRNNDHAFYLLKNCLNLG